MGLVTRQSPELISRGAELSDCKRYRYVLHRSWDLGAARSMLFIMLNPSTADALVDDQTIRRCMHFARREGMGGVHVVNLYAWRATDPAQLSEAFDPEGPQNTAIVDQYIATADDLGCPIVCAWGSHDLAREVGDVLVTRHRLDGVDFKCLGKTKDGYPRHPSRLANDVPLESYP